jgi:hypothetical protein
MNQVSRSSDWKNLIPTELQPLFAKAPVLQTEIRADYDALLYRLAVSIAPRDDIEWIWLKDYIDHSWEIRRYRESKARILEIASADALISIAKAIDSSPVFIADAGFSALWFGDEADKNKCRKILSQHGISEDAVHAQALLCRASDLEKIEAMQASAEARRNAVVREIGQHREKADLFRKLSQDIIDGEYIESPPLSPPVVNTSARSA